MAIKKQHKTLKLSQIKPYPKNEKIHTKDNMLLIRASLDEIGYINPIIVDDTNTILAGHGRFFVMKEDGVESVEVLKVSGLTDVQKEKYRLYDNQSSRTGKYDQELLIETVQGILDAEEDFNISILAIDGLAESFSDEVFAFDLGSKKVVQAKNKASVVVIVTEDLPSVIGVLDKEQIKYVLGNERTTTK